MKKTFSLVHFLIVLTCALGLAGVAAAKEPSALGRVTVAAVWGSGHASYSTDHGKTWSRLWPNKELSAGAVVKTDGNEKVDLFVNGTAAIRLDKNSEIRFDQIAGLSAPVGSSGSIRINLKAGTIDGSAKKVANGDSCDIAIPTGTVSTGGADFEVSVVETSAGVFEPAFFGCLNGSMQVELAANGGLPVTKVIAAQQIWNPIVVLDPVLVATSDLPMSLIQARKEIDQLLLTIHRSSNPSVNPPSFDITAPIGPVPGEFMLLPQPTQPRTFGYPPPPPLPVSPPILGQ